MIRFLLVLRNFETWMITTPFAEQWQLQQWLNGLQIDCNDFIHDPIANLPPRSFANFVVADEEGEYEDSIRPTDAIMDTCHGTLMVDDNDSIFYSPKIRNAEWKLPYLLHQAGVHYTKI